MDCENAVLEDWGSSKRAHPKGPKRYEDPEWAELIKKSVYPHHSDVDWAEFLMERSGLNDEDKREIKRALKHDLTQSKPIWDYLQLHFPEIHEPDQPVSTSDAFIDAFAALLRAIIPHPRW